MPLPTWDNLPLEKRDRVLEAGAREFGRAGFIAGSLNTIAREAGTDVAPMPFRPVLRGLLLTGFVPRYLRTDIASGTSVVDTEALWWPPGKIVGRYLAPFLAEHLGLDASPPGGTQAGAVPVEIELS